MSDPDVNWMLYCLGDSACTLMGNYWKTTDCSPDTCQPDLTSAAACHPQDDMFCATDPNQAMPTGCELCSGACVDPNTGKCSEARVSAESCKKNQVFCSLENPSGGAPGDSNDCSECQPFYNQENDPSCPDSDCFTIVGTSTPQATLFPKYPEAPLSFPLDFVLTLPPGTTSADFHVAVVAPFNDPPPSFSGQDGITWEFVAGPDAILNADGTYTWDLIVRFTVQAGSGKILAQSTTLRTDVVLIFPGFAGSAFAAAPGSPGDSDDSSAWILLMVLAVVMCCSCAAIACLLGWLWFSCRRQRRDEADNALGLKQASVSPYPIEIDDQAELGPSADPGPVGSKCEPPQDVSEMPNASSTSLSRAAPEAMAIPVPARAQSPMDQLSKIISPELSAMPTSPACFPSQAPPLGTAPAECAEADQTHTDRQPLSRPDVKTPPNKDPLGATLQQVWTDYQDAQKRVISLHVVPSIYAAECPVPESVSPRVSGADNDDDVPDDIPQIPVCSDCPHVHYMEPSCPSVPAYSQHMSAMQPPSAVQTFGLQGLPSTYNQPHDHLSEEGDDVYEPGGQNVAPAISVERAGAITPPDVQQVRAGKGNHLQGTGHRRQPRQGHFRESQVMRQESQTGNWDSAADLPLWASPSSPRLKQGLASAHKPAPVVTSWPTVSPTDITVPSNRGCHSPGSPSSDKRAHVSPMSAGTSRSGAHSPPVTPDAGRRSLVSPTQPSACPAAGPLLDTAGSLPKPVRRPTVQSGVWK
eukprot:gene1042-2627_t